MMPVVHTDKFFQLSDNIFRYLIIEDGRINRIFFLIRLIALLLMDIAKDTAKTINIGIVV